jgi:hypothetical protein
MTMERSRPSTVRTAICSGGGNGTVGLDGVRFGGSVRLRRELRQSSFRFGHRFGHGDGRHDDPRSRRNGPVLGGDQPKRRGRGRHLAQQRGRAPDRREDQHGDRRGRGRGRRARGRRRQLERYDRLRH